MLQASSDFDSNPIAELQRNGRLISELAQRGESLRRQLDEVQATLNRRDSPEPHLTYGQHYDNVARRIREMQTLANSLGLVERQLTNLEHKLADQLGIETWETYQDLDLEIMHKIEELVQQQRRRGGFRADATFRERARRPIHWRDLVEPTQGRWEHEQRQELRFLTTIRNDITRFIDAFYRCVSDTLNVPFVHLHSAQNLQEYQTFLENVTPQSPSNQTIIVNTFGAIHKIGKLILVFAVYGSGDSFPFLLSYEQAITVDRVPGYMTMLNLRPRTNIANEIVASAMITHSEHLWYTYQEGDIRSRMGPFQLQSAYADEVVVLEEV